MAESNISNILKLNTMYSLKENATGKWLLDDNSGFVTWDAETDPNIMETDTEAELEGLRDAYNSHNAGRCVIGQSPRPH